MKKILLIVLAMFLLPGISSAQMGAEVFSRHTIVALDSTDTMKVFIPFWAPRANVKRLPNGTEIDPKKLQVRKFYASTVDSMQFDMPDGIFNLGNLVVLMYIDSVAAGVTDSLITWAQKVDANGKVFGDTLHLDWVTDHRVESATNWWDNMINWEKHSAQADTFKCYYWIDVSGEYEPCMGIMIGFMQTAAGTSNGFRSRIRLFTQETR